MSVDTPARDAPTEPGSLRDTWPMWLRIGALSFGGPAAQIALLHGELVERRRWVSDARFLHALRLCTALPGPEAQQLATYLGWLLHGPLGGVVAGLCFILPGAALLLVASVAYWCCRDTRYALVLRFGVGCAVLALLVDAALRLGARVLKRPAERALALGAFALTALDAAPFPALVAGAAAIGAAAPSRFTPPPAPTRSDGAEAPLGPVAWIDRAEAQGLRAHAPPSWRRTVATLAAGLIAWLGPPLGLAAWFGSESVFVHEARFFGATAVVSFGGAYAVLAHVAASATGPGGWVSTAELVDGIGLAESLPGPLVLATQFVGFLGASRAPTGLPAPLAGALGALVTSAMTFVPSFTLVLALAPHVEGWRARPGLAAALTAITSAVVGVLAHLAVGFAAQTLFAAGGAVHFGLEDLGRVSVHTLRLDALALSALCFFAVRRGHAGPGRTLALGVAVGAALRLTLDP